MCWGPSYAFNRRPRPIELGDVVELAYGVDACARRADGTVVCWRPSPYYGPILREISIQDAVDLEANGNAHCAVRRGGDVVCWPALASDSADPEPPTAPHPELDDVVALRAGGVAALGEGRVGCWCALHSDGRASCWGTCGLPGASDSPSDAPFELAGLGDLRDLVLGPSSACALSASRGVLCAGEVFERERPRRPRRRRGAPPPPGWFQVDAPHARWLAWDRDALRCAIDGDSARVCWSERSLSDPCLRRRGEDEAGECLGLPDALAPRVEEVAQVSAQGGCASLREGGVSCWGRASDGRLGREVVIEPRRVEGLERARQLSVHFETACVLEEDREVYCWGAPRWHDDVPVSRLHVAELDGSEEIVLGSLSLCGTRRGQPPRCVGALVDEAAGERFVDLPFLRGSTSLSPWSRRVCGVVRGRVRCVDRGYADGAPTLVEQTVPGIRDAVAVHRSGVARATGAIGRMVRTDEPIQRWFFEEGSSRRSPWLAFEVWVGDQSACGVREDGRVDMTGRRADRFGPLRAAAIRTRDGCGVREDGGLVCWGLNLHGQLGQPPARSGGAPVTIEGITDVVEVGVGAEFACARTEDGSVFCWGSAADHRLGVSPEPSLDARAVPNVR